MGLDMISSHSFRQLFAFRLGKHLLDSLAFPPADARRGGGSAYSLVAPNFKTRRMFFCVSSGIHSIRI